MMGFYRKNFSFVVLHERKMVAKEGKFINLVMGRWGSCLLAAVFLLNCSNVVAKSLSENEGSRKFEREEEGVVLANGKSSFLEKCGNCLAV